MPTHTFACSCGHRLEDLFFKVKDIPRYKICSECKKRMYQTFGESFNFKRSLTDILGPNAKHHPQIGTDIEITSPDHYYQLLKEFGMQEAGDTKGGNRNWQREKIEKDKERNRRKRTMANIATDEQVREAFL